MTKTNGIYLKLSIEKDAINNIRNAINETKRNYPGLLSLSIRIDGQGFSIPIQASNYITKEQIVKLINYGKYDLYNEKIDLLYELKLVDTAAEESAVEGALPDLLSF